MDLHSWLQNPQTQPFTLPAREMFNSQAQKAPQGDLDMPYNLYGVLVYVMLKVISSPLTKISIGNDSAPYYTDFVLSEMHDVGRPHRLRMYRERQKGGRWI